MQLPAAGLEPNASADGKERMHQCEQFRVPFSTTTRYAAI
jgi:hypothetical protein